MLMLIKASENNSIENKIKEMQLIIVNQMQSEVENNINNTNALIKETQELDQKISKTTEKANNFIKSFNSKN